MRFWQRVGLVCALALSSLFVLAAPVLAETVTVTIGVGDTIMSVSGKTSPNAFVTISKDGGVIGTTTAAADGTYSQTFPAQDPGVHELSVFAHTTGGDNTDTVTLSVNITEHATTAIEIFLPSTLNLADSSLDVDQPLVLSGEAAPSSQVNIYIDNNDFAAVTTNALGQWSASLGSGSLQGGNHQVFVRVTDSFGEQSYPSAQRLFSLQSATSTPAPITPALPPPIGNAPTVPVITFPSSDTVWQEPEITISGTAGPNVQIELWDGSTLIGSIWSNGRGGWAFPLTLEPRSYALRARACLDGVCSRFSPTINFKYQPGGMQSPLARPLKIKVPKSSFITYQHSQVTLKALVLDGQPPYKTRIQWDSRQESTGTYPGDDLTFMHRYAKPGKYLVTLDVQDAQGRSGRVYFAIQVRPLPQPFTIPPAVIIVLLLFIALLIFYLIRRHKPKTPD